MISPKISIITTFYNRQLYLAQCIESVLKQTETNFEYILWDDGSTDHSLSIALAFSKQDSRITVVKAPHRGLPYPLVGAMQLTRGQYSGWVDSDDWIAPDCLEKTSALLNQEPDVGLVYTDYWSVNDEGENLGLGYRCGIPYCGKDTLLVVFMTFHFRLFRKNVWNKLPEPINLNLKGAIDYDFCLKVSEVTKIYHIEEPLYYYRFHSQALSNTTKKQQNKFAAIALREAFARRGYLDISSDNSITTT